MPTGYTADIAQGITFKQYALSCARAFGALIIMRDDPQDAPIPDEFAPSDYHSKALAEATSKLKELRSLSMEELRLKSDSERAERIAYNKEGRAKAKDLREKYEAMLREAKAYKAPSPEHIEYQKFLVSQIEESIKWDCGTDYFTDPAEMTGQEYFDMMDKKFVRDIEYHSKKHALEVERSANRTQWVKDLKQSLAIYP